MKRTFVWCAMALLSLMVAAQAQANMGGGTEKAVAALEQQWVDAAKANNTDALAPLLADKFVNTDSDGKVTGKAETLANAKASKMETDQISDVKVTVFGNTAIATGDWVGKGKDAKGKPVDAHERWTDTWMKMSNGKWQCVASHSSPIKT
ncbi:MAG TPA: nuclear transport factor 2 family protein [Terriglobales bacterium]|jgi:ketosteroid isomerase-like protein|nr:nuclear transport factor 2 family protein [Terriglobales bacterium]